MIEAILISLGCSKVLGKTHTYTLSGCSSTEVENI